MNAKIVLEQSEFDHRIWFWSVLVDGEVYADGTESSKAEAKFKAKKNLQHFNDHGA